MLSRFVILACCLVFAFATIVLPFPEGFAGVAVAGVITGCMIFVLRRYTEETTFITNVVLLGLAIRLAFGIFVHLSGTPMREFFGGDAITYDMNGAAMVNVWFHNAPMTADLIYQNDPASGAGWGMNYFVGAIYTVVGHNLFAAQSICAVVGALTAPIVFFCAHKIYGNLRVAKFAALSIALFPSFIIWSSQLLKDGLMIFLIVLAMTMVLQLQRKFGYAALALLIFSLFGIFALRFYVFYIVVIAVVGSFAVGMSRSNQSLVRRGLALVLIGLALFYLGVVRNASIKLDRFGSLQRIQSSRHDLVRSAESGYGAEADVSTTEGALSALPLGFAYLMFAPFPWQAANLRQAITIPEVFLWWALIPFLISGLIWSVRNRLRDGLPILLFSLMLTLSYSIFQGNVGTAYRQRTQIQVFLFIFIAAGWTIYQENRENQRILRAAAKRRVDESLRAGLRASH